MGFKLLRPLAPKNAILGAGRAKAELFTEQQVFKHWTELWIDCIHCVQKVTCTCSNFVTSHEARVTSYGHLLILNVRIYFIHEMCAHYNRFVDQKVTK